MTDRDTVARLLAANRYLVLATADAAGVPWATPVFFAAHDTSVYWVSSPDSRHSRNIAARPGIAMTVFDSTVDIGHGEAVYFEADAAPTGGDGIDDALGAMNSRLAAGRGLSRSDLAPEGPLVVYGAAVRSTYVLVRGGDPDQGNVVDMTREVGGDSPG